MCSDLIEVNINDYDLSAFDMLESSVKPHKFKGPDGKEQQYFDGDLTYHGKPPYFFIEGDTFGVQIANAGKKEEGDAAASAPVAMIQLPVASNPNAAAPEIKKQKWQIAVKLSAQASPAQWTAIEQRTIEFINDDLRRVVADILSRRIEILKKIGSNALADAQERFRSDMSDPITAARFPTTELQVERMRILVRDTLYTKISRKVYRKKLEAPKGATANIMEAVKYDETKHPMLYADIMSKIDKVTKKPEYTTTYYQFVAGKEESEWPRLTHEEVVERGSYRMQLAARFDKVYFGNTIAPQIKFCEVVLLTPISNAQGHKGRLIKAPASVPRNTKLISRGAIQPAGESGNSNVAPLDPSLGQGHIAPVGFSIAQLQSQPMNVPFDPSVMAGIPGIGQLPLPGQATYTTH
jgi:hypothetical protein